MTDDPHLLCAADGIDLILEVTGAVDFGARVVLDAIEHGKHILLMNAELDGTVGPLLKAKADAAGVMYGNVDGDQPGVIMNLYRFVEGLGATTKLLGNIKGLQDPYRNPTTQQGFAERWGQTPSMVTSFADGTKVNFEMAIVANNTGFTAAKRGLYQPEVPGGTPIEEIADYFPVDKILESDGIIDYCVGASPGPGCSHSPPTTTRCTSTTSTSTSWGRGRCTSSTRRTTCATSRCPTASCVWSTSPMLRWRPSAPRWWRSWPSPRPTSRPAP